MIYYFTGTGNSLWTAKTVGEAIHQPTENIIKYRKEKTVICEDSIIGFVFPTYMGDLPWIAKEFLLKIQIKPNSYVFLIMTSNHGESGISFKSLDQALSLSSGKLSAGFDLQMPGNCLISSDVENTKRLQKAPGQIQNICREIEQQIVNYISDGSKPSEDFVTGSYFYGKHSFKRLTLMKNFQITKNCNGCGVCVSVCPMANIEIKGSKAVHGHNCAACYACLHWCPKNATLLNVPTLKHRTQYHHPEIQIQDLILN